MKKTILATGTLWSLLVVLSFFWNYYSARQEQKAIALQSARSFFEQILITRSWNDSHGGVYVPVTEATPPNPYLDDPLRDIQVSRNLKLTKINPAYMTRQISEIAETKSGVRFRITSLKPLRPENRPSLREEQALLAFEKGAKEVSEIVHEGTARYFFYMAPLAAEKTCLACHAKQGYAEGDIRGGISIAMSLLPGVSVFALLISHLAIGIAGLAGIVYSGFQLEKAYEKIKNQAFIDGLTEIHNHRSFAETILREVNRCRRNQTDLAVIMCDVDNFKAYNDTYGHQQGDECLKKVAEALKNALKRPGDYCARYGGEEFCVILPDTTLNGALAIAEQIRINVQAMGMPHQKSLPAGVVTISLGVSARGTADVTADELIKMADTALYKAKEKGKNRTEADA